MRVISEHQLSKIRDQYKMVRYNKTSTRRLKQPGLPNQMPSTLSTSVQDRVANDAALNGVYCINWVSNYDATFALQITWFCSDVDSSACDYICGRRG